LGTIESAKAAYDKVLELKIANAQVIVNYAQFLEENKYFEESFKVYERGVELFTFPVSFEIWNTYLSKFTKRYVSTRIPAWGTQNTSHRFLRQNLRVVRSWSAPEICSNRRWKNALRSLANPYSSCTLSLRRITAWLNVQWTSTIGGLNRSRTGISLRFVCSPSLSL
jgi:hypothetical protein